MASLNKTMIIGRLGRDPEVTYMQTGTAVCKLNIATSEVWNDKNTGEKKEKTEWHRITFFGKSAETIGRYMSKGSQIYVEGKLQTSQYEKDGITRYSTDIIGSHFQFIGGKQQQDNSGFQQDPKQQQPQGGFQQQASGFQQPQNQGGFQQPQQPETFGKDMNQQFRPDDDIPF